MPNLYPAHIFGMHDRGGEHLILNKGRRGWVLVTEAVGADPNNHGGSNYTDLTNQGLGVIVRLNNGYGDAGTIPVSAQYDDFARRCGHFAEASPGCHIWIIGNEMNLAWERPGGPGGQPITPDLYAACFTKCRNEIRWRPGHADDQVVVGAVGPWNAQTTYPGNLRGDWVRYFADILALLGQNVDGISLHTYSHGQDPGLVFSDDKMNVPFTNYHWHFRAYRDFMAAIPAGLRDRPVYITETDQYGPWRDANTGWVRNAYQEINEWNQNPSHQPIQALILFRWPVGNPSDPQQVGWAIENKPGVQNDFRDAMNNNYAVVLPTARPQYRVAWLAVGAPGRMNLGTLVEFAVTVRNDGRMAWAATGAQAVRLGSRWINSAGTSTLGLRTNLPHAVAAGGTVTLPRVGVQAPSVPGYYTLELDMVQGASTWFSAQGSALWRLRDVRVGDRYRAVWLSAAAPAQGTAGGTVTFPVRVRNAGALTWPPSGANPVNLTYKWLDAARQVVVADGLRTPLGRTVAPLEELLVNATIQFPPAPGQYILQLDMVHEFVTWFQWKGSPVFETQVQVASAAPEFAAEWVKYVAPDHLAAGQVGSAYIEVKNVGSGAWPSAGAEAVRLGYRWLDMQGQEVPVPDAKTQPLPGAIQPGQTATFRSASFITPGTPGAYRLVWDLVQAGASLSARGMAVREQSVQLAPPEYAVEWNVLDPWPGWLPPGAEQRTNLYVRNVGTKTWAAGGERPVHLAYHWFTESGRLSEPWDTFRIPLPHDVAPADAVELRDLPFKTPSMIGRYTLRWDLVEEGRAWFFRQGGAPLEVPVEISDRVLWAPWTAQASHNPGEVALAFDGNPDTFWDSKSNQVPGMWFELDLGAVLVLDRVRAYSPGRGFAAGYRVALSQDGRDWHLVAEQEKNWADLDVAFAPCSARYVRLEQTGTPEWAATWMISDIVVSVTQPWAAAGASHYTGDAHRAIDARLQSAWTTRAVEQKPGIWFEIDMGSLRNIERITLQHPTNQYPRGYMIQVSTDAQDRQEVAHLDDNWNKVDVQFQPTVARYVRIQTTNSSDYTSWGISEIAIWRSSPVWLRGRGS